MILALLTLLIPCALAQDLGATPRLGWLPAGLPPTGASTPPREARATAKEDVQASLDPTDLWLPGGQTAVFALDLAAGTIEATLPTLGLTDAALAAVAEVPDWLRPHLSVTLSHLEAERQDEVAAALMEAVGEAWLDEFAFTVAATSPEELAIDSRYLLLDVLADNARGVYAADPLVPFAELTEDGEHTSVRYTWDDGTGPQTWDLPWEHYYWYVVNPKLDMELPLFMDPERYSLSAPPEGVHWRTWMLTSATEEGTWDYRTHWLQEEPNELADAIEADPMGWLHDFAVDPLVVLADVEGHTLLAESDYGAGTLLASAIAMDVADGAFDQTDLVENVALYVQRRDLLEGAESTLILSDLEGHGWAVQAALEVNGLPVETWDLAQGMPDLGGFLKIVLPAGLLPEAAAVAWAPESIAALEAFVSGGGTLLVEADADLGDEQIYPGGFSATAGTPGAGAFVGHPVLAESLAGIESLWDGAEQPGLSGDRALADVTHALDAVGWFVTQNMFDNVSEYASTHSDYDGERAVWPQRILHEHFGNCGECQDMITGAGRAALVPVVNVWSIEDHVWNEFYFQDAWHPYQVDWSDGPTRIDHGGVAYDVQHGGGKNVSAIMAFHENGRVDDEHIALYSDTITAEVTVTDTDGQPVAGAMVLVAVENFYYGQYLDQAAWVHTDQTGSVEITLGDSRNFWFLAAADLTEGEVWAPYSILDIQSGTYPNWFLENEAGDPTIAAEEAVAGAHFGVPLMLAGHIGRPAASEQAGAGKATVDVSVDLGLDATLLDVPAKHTFLGWYASLDYAYGGGLVQPLDAPGTLDVYLVDADNLALFESDQAFVALGMAEGTRGVPMEFSFETAATELYLLVSNRGSPRHAHHGQIAVASYRVLDSDEDDEGGRCACTAAPRAPCAWLLGFLALLGLATARRR